MLNLALLPLGWKAKEIAHVLFSSSLLAKDSASGELGSDTKGTREK
jgi:hypothetical protein